MTRNVELPLRHKNLDKRPAPAIYMESFLAAGELKAKDVDFHYAKATPDRFAALVSGGVDAAILYPPATFRAASQGFTYLGDITDHLKSFPFAVYAANTDWAAKNRPAMLGYVKAYSRSLRWVYDTNNKEKAVDILVKYSKQDRKDTVDTYDYFMGHGHPRQAHCPGLALAEWLCRKTDRINSSRVR